MNKEITPLEALYRIIEEVKKQADYGQYLVKDLKYESVDTVMGYPLYILVNRAKATEIISRKGFNRHFFRSAIQNAFNYGYKSYEYYNEHAKSNYTKEEFYFIAEVFDKEIWEDER